MVVPVLNKQGVEVDKVTIDEHSLGSVVQPALLKQAYVRYHANTRQGSARTKNRREVEGSTKKIYKQKGTGNARHGDRKVNTMKGGGHAHSKKRTREDYRLDMPKKMRRKANRNALLAKLIDNEVRIVDDLSMSTPKTKDLVSMLAALKTDKSVLLALSVDADNTRLAARNLDNLTLCRSDQLNCFELLNNRYLIIGKSELQSWLSGPSSQTGKNAKIAPMGAAKKESK
ncbi:MAG: 50S ribosomal protein L4 [Phycisphaerales bacterium]